MHSDKDKFLPTNMAYDIFQNKYADWPGQMWQDKAFLIVEEVCNGLLTTKEKKELYEMVRDMEFMPGGRYIYYGGKEANFYNNCFIFKSKKDSREEWATLMQDITGALMTGGGVGNDYSVFRPKGSKLGRTGGEASGPIPLMKMVNEAGRNVMQGGSRRSAILASLNWRHRDIKEFIHIKDWNNVVVGDTTLDKIKEKDFNFPAPLDMTNICVNYDTNFAEIINTGVLPTIFIDNCRQALKTAEPGMSFNFYEKEKETGRNACQPSYAKLLTPEGIRQLSELEEGDTIWSGSKWTKIVKKWSTGIKPVYKYVTTTGNFIGTYNHKIIQNGERCEVDNAESIDWSVGESEVVNTIDLQDVMDGLVIGSGFVHNDNNLVYLYIEDKDYDYLTDYIKDLLVRRVKVMGECAWEVVTTIQKSELTNTNLKTIPDRFYYGSYKTKCGFLRGLFSARGFMCGNIISLNQTSKQLIMQVQEMLSSLGIHSYITVNKNSSTDNEYYGKDSYNLNITSGRTLFRDNIGFIQTHEQNAIIDSSKPKYLTSSIKDVEYLGFSEVYEITVEDEDHTYWTGGCLVSNCGEVTSEDDGDVCNLGSINLARINDVERLERVIELATKFLVCGSIKADLPSDKIKKVREKNRLLGLGLMGVHEWLMQRGYRYELTPELRNWLKLYKKVSDETADTFCRELNISVPKRKRAIAPTGTIGILAGTTTGIEPLFAVAYKRRYLINGDQWHEEIYIDRVAEDMINKYGLDPYDIESAMDLAKDPERRIKFQADVQDYVDMAISSTLNLPAWGTEYNNEERVEDFAKVLAKYAPRLRGFTCYPDGARGGQPLVPMDYYEAKKALATLEDNDSCKGGVCGL